MTDLVWEELGRSIAGPSDGGADVWVPLGESLDISRFAPCVANHVEVRRFEPARSEAYAIAANRADLVYYRLSLVEADYMEAMDGTRPVGELVVDRLRDTGDLDIAGVADLVVMTYPVATPSPPAVHGQLPDPGLCRCSGHGGGGPPSPAGLADQAVRVLEDPVY